MEQKNSIKSFLFVLLLSLFFSACQNGSGDETAVHDTTSEVLVLPELSAISLQTAKLKVVVTTSIIGDVVARVGGEAIDLTVLIAAGQDPHSYEPGARDLTAVADAHVIFINGWDLEEGLLDNLANVAEAGVIVPVSVGIAPRELDMAGQHHSIDPHVWLDPQNVKLWATNIEQVLATLDSANAAVYADNAATYQQELDDLLLEMDEAMAKVNGRSLVTNHDALGYLAARYDLKIIGTVLPGASTLAEPSASELTELATKMQEAATCTIFAESTANTQLANALAEELNYCAPVQILSLYTGAVGTAGSGADSYIGMMQANIQALVEGLK